MIKIIDNINIKLIGIIKAILFKCIFYTNLLKLSYERKRKLRNERDEILEKNFTFSSGADYNSDIKIDYNSLVDDLFPLDKSHSERLSEEEKVVYDKLKEDLIWKDNEFKKLSAFDRLLYERMRISGMILNSKNRIETVSKYKNAINNQIESISIPAIKSSKYTYDDALSNGTIINSRNKRESKSERKLSDDLPNFDDFDSQFNNFENELLQIPQEMNEINLNNFDFRISDNEDFIGYQQDDELWFFNDSKFKY